jgi:hypothetical protein
MESPLTLSLLFGPEEEHDLPIIEDEVPVTPVSGNIYRLEGTSAFGGGMYGDLIEALPEPDGSHRFIRVVEPSGYRVLSWCLRREVVKSPEFTKFAEMVMDAGGMWELLMGGVVHVHLPPESPFDAESELQAVHEAVAAHRR